MSDNRKQILSMLAEGRIDADQAERLLAALEGGGASSASSSAAAPAKLPPRYLRVLIERDDERDGEARTKVNIRVPLQLLRAGVKLQSLLPPDARAQMNKALAENGVALDLDKIKPENIEELIANLQDVSIDVSDRKHRQVTIKLFCE
jgi:hypothetical protein